MNIFLKLAISALPPLNCLYFNQYVLRNIVHVNIECSWRSLNSEKGVRGEKYTSVKPSDSFGLITVWHMVFHEMSVAHQFHSSYVAIWYQKQIFIGIRLDGIVFTSIYTLPQSLNSRTGVCWLADCPDIVLWIILCANHNSQD